MARDWLADYTHLPYPTYPTHLTCLTHLPYQIPTCPFTESISFAGS
jgi:hypothetical protein